MRVLFLAPVSLFFMQDKDAGTLVQVDFMLFPEMNRFGYHDFSRKGKVTGNTKQSIGVKALNHLFH